MIINFDPTSEFDILVMRRLCKTIESARTRSKDFNLTFEHLYNLMKQTHCAYSGEKFKGVNCNDSMTLERWDNDKGYVIGNVIAVKKKYNNLRGDLTLAQLERACGLPFSNSKECYIEASTPKTVALHGTIENIKNNLTKRAFAMKLWEDFMGPHDEFDIRKYNATAKRVENAKMVLEIHQNKLSSITKVSIHHKVKTKHPEDREGYAIIAKALQRLDKMSVHDYVRLKKGLPLLERK